MKYSIYENKDMVLHDMQSQMISVFKQLRICDIKRNWNECDFSYEPHVTCWDVNPLCLGFIWGDRKSICTFYHSSMMKPCWLLEFILNIIIIHIVIIMAADGLTMHRTMASTASTQYVKEAMSATCLCVVELPWSGCPHPSPLPSPSCWLTRHYICY